MKILLKIILFIFTVVTLLSVLRPSFLDDLFTADILITASAIIAFLAIITLLVLVIIFQLSSLGWQFTEPEKGNVTFINKANDMYDVWPNVGGYRMSYAEDLEGRHWLVREPDEEKRLDAFFHKASPRTLWLQKWLWKKFSIRFVSFFYPKIRVHKFNVSRKRIREGTDITVNAPLRDRVVDSPESPTVSSLLFLVPRPLYMEGIELAGDNSKVNLLLLPIYQQVIPVIPVYYLKGDFFSPLDTAIEAVIIDFFATHLVAIDSDGNFLEGTYHPEKAQEPALEKGRRGYLPSHLTYTHWLKIKKTDGSPLERHLRSLNASDHYYKSLEEAIKEDPTKAELLRQLKVFLPGEPTKVESADIAKEIGSGIIPRFGFGIISLRLVDWQPHKDTQILANALLAKEIEFHTAEGVRQKAYGERDAILAKKTGEAKRYAGLIGALKKNKVSPDIAAMVLNTQVRTENIRDSNIVYYAEGGAPSTTSAMVPLPPVHPAESSK